MIPNYGSHKGKAALQLVLKVLCGVVRELYTLCQHLSIRSLAPNIRFLTGYKSSQIKDLDLWFCVIASTRVLCRDQLSACPDGRRVGGKLGARELTFLLPWWIANAHSIYKRAYGA